MTADEILEKFRKRAFILNGREVLYPDEAQIACINILEEVKKEPRKKFPCGEMIIPKPPCLEDPLITKLKSIEQGRAVIVSISEYHNKSRFTSYAHSLLRTYGVKVVVKSLANMAGWKIKRLK